MLAGDSNTAGGFDGGDDRIEFGDPSDGHLDVGTGDFTIEAWVKATANDERVIIAKRTTSGGYWQVTVSDDSNHAGEIRANVFDGTTLRQAYGPALRVDDGNWHHVVVTFDRDVGITIYVDGVARSTAGAFTGDASNTGALVIGKGSGYPNYRGVLDEVALYPSLLSPARIQAHAQAAASTG